MTKRPAANFVRRVSAPRGVNDSRSAPESPVRFGRSDKRLVACRMNERDGRRSFKETRSGSARKQTLAVTFKVSRPVRASFAAC